MQNIRLKPDILCEVCVWVGMGGLADKLQLTQVRNGQVADMSGSKISFVHHSVTCPISVAHLSLSKQ